MLIDVLTFIVALIAFWQGFKSGLIKTLFRVIGLVLAFILTLKCTPIVSELLSTISSSPFIPIFAIIGTFLMAIITFKVIANTLEGILKAVRLNILNQIIGGLISVIISVFLLSCVFTFFDKATLLPKSIQATSYAYPHLQPVPEKGIETVKIIFPMVKDMYFTVDELLDQIPTNAKPPNRNSTGR